MVSRVELDELLPEAKLNILRCLCGGAESLPVKELAAMGGTSREWCHLSAAPEILPFGATLRCRLLTPNGPSCKRHGHVWPPSEPLEAHRLRESQPLGERDQLTHLLHTCFRRGFEPALELHETHMQNPIDLDTWMGLMQRFRAEHFGGETGRPREGAPEGDSPAPIWNAAACALPGGRVCVAGGGCYSFELADAQTNSVEVFWHQPAVYVFDVRARRWTRQNVTGDLPPPGHAFASAHTRLGSRLVIWCGGYYGKAYNTAYALDTEKWEWHALRNSSAQAPSERYFAASFEFDGGLFAWGGRSSENVYPADLWRLDPSRAHQDVVHMEGIKPSGDLPSGKFAASLTNCDDRFALLFGGGQWKRGGLFKPDIETFTLDLSSFAWTRLELQGPRPTTRCQHSAVNLGGNMVLVLGGYDGCCRRYLGLEDVCVLNVRGLRWMTLGRRRPRPPRLRLRAGMRVQLVGLRNAEDMNGLTGTLQSYHRARDRWMVRLDGDRGTHLFRVEHLQRVEEGGDAQPGGAPRDMDVDSDENSEDELQQRHDEHAPAMLSPAWEDASEKLQWISGQFPSARAGIAVADASDASSSRRLFYLFGGAQYVHQEWYGDLYECSLHREAQ